MKNLIVYARFLFVVSVIALLAFYFLFKPKESVPNQSFRICIIIENSPKIIYLDEYQSSLAMPLCQSPFRMIPDNGTDLIEFSMIEQNNRHEVWELVEETGSMADPRIYTYKISENQITPIWQKKGGNFAWFISVIISFTLSFLLYFLI